MRFPLKQRSNEPRSKERIEPRETLKAFREFFSCVNFDDDLYNILSFIRGPDVDDLLLQDRAKALTMYIRSLLFDEKTRFYYKRDITPYIVDACKQMPAHWRAHATYAVNSLITLGVDVPKEIRDLIAEIIPPSAT